MNDQRTDIVQTSTEQSVPSQNNSAPVATSEEKSTEKKNNNKIYVIIAIILFALIIGELGFVFLYHNSAFKQLLPSFSIMSWMKETNSPKNSVSTPIVTPTVQDDIVIPVPTGQQDANGTGAAAGFSVHVEKVTEAPTDISGDKPLKGLQYIEFDVSVTNNTNKTTLIPGVFYFQDTALGKLLMPADIFGYMPAYNWIFTGLSQKHVEVSGKTPLMTTEIPAGQTVKTLYLIYQIPQGDKGKLVWDNASTIVPVIFGKNAPTTEFLQGVFIQLMMADGKLKLFELHATNSENGRVVVFSIP